VITTDYGDRYTSSAPAIPTSPERKKRGGAWPASFARCIIWR